MYPPHPSSHWSFVNSPLCVFCTPLLLQAVYSVLTFIVDINGNEMFTTYYFPTLSGIKSCNQFFSLLKYNKWVTNI